MLTVPWVGLQCVIVVFPDHHLLQSVVVDSLSIVASILTVLCVLCLFCQAVLRVLSSFAVVSLEPDMRLSTMWCVRPAKPQISLRIRAV